MKPSETRGRRKFSAMERSALERSDIDFSVYELDEPLPELETNGERGSLDKFAQWGSGKTLRQLVLDAGGTSDSIELVGTPEQVADKIGEAMEQVGGDGFLISTQRVSTQYITEICEGCSLRCNARDWPARSTRTRTCATRCASSEMSVLAVVNTTVEAAVADLRAGRMVIVVDAENPKDDGDLMFAASHATPERVAFMVRHTSGILCVPMPASDLDRLHLPPMVVVNEDPRGVGYSVTVDARTGISSGISAADRAHTISLLANPDTQPSDLSRPGHVFPLRAVDGGVLRRAGHTEAAVDLARLAGLPPVAVIGEVVDDDERSHAEVPARLCLLASPDHRDDGRPDRLPAPHRAPSGVQGPSRLPTHHGEFQAHGFRSVLDDREHIALVMGDVPAQGDTPTLVRVHSEC